jgi:hypothetical protein
MDDESASRSVVGLSPESGIVLEGTECTVNSEKTLEELEAVESARSNGLPPNQLFNFNLANPEEVMTMLETVDLTDEDTDVLLQEAYNINKKLKEVLRRRDEGQVLDAADQAILNQMVVVVPGSSKESRSSTAKEGQQASGGSDIPKKDPLPPIKTDTEQNPRVASAIYSAKLNRRAPMSVPSSRSGVRKQGGDVVWKKDRVGSGVSRTSVQIPGSSTKVGTRFISSLRCQIMQNCCD